MSTNDYLKQLFDRQMQLDAEIQQSLPQVVPAIFESINELKNSLRQIATRYPNNEYVKKNLMEYFSSGESTIAKRPYLSKPTRVKHNGPYRVVPRLELEYNDGTKFEYASNPARRMLAQILQRDNSNLKIVAGTENRMIFITVNNSRYRLVNPIRDNHSGFKTIRAI